MARQWSRVIFLWRNPVSDDNSVYERIQILKLLGYDENGNGLVTTDEDGNRICHDPYYDLEGVRSDLENGIADKVCIQTIERIQKRLVAITEYVRKNPL